MAKFGWKTPGFRGDSGKKKKRKGSRVPRGVHKSILAPRQSSVSQHSPIPNRLAGLRLAGKSSFLLKRRRQQGEHKQHLHILNSILAPLGLFLSRQKHNRSARPEKGQGTAGNVGQRERENKSRAWEWLRAGAVPAGLVCSSGWDKGTRMSPNPCAVWG